MKKTATIVGVLLALAVCLYLVAKFTHTEFKGVDETVVEKAAENAGRKASKPLIDTDRGDLLLCVFLIAGAVGGFVAGYVFRGLFPPKEGTDNP